MLFWIIGTQKLCYFDQTTVLYISKFQTLLGKLNFRSSHFSNSACIWSAKNAWISRFLNLNIYAVLNYWQTKPALFWSDFSSLHFKIQYIVGKVQFQKFTFLILCTYLVSEKCLDFCCYKPYFLGFSGLLASGNWFILIRLLFSTH